MNLIEKLKLSKETSLFEKRLKEGFYDETPLNVSNEEIDYDKLKLERDTQAVEDFAKSKLFKELMTIK